jgi:hypothetical protein
MAFVVMSALELIRNLDLKQDSALLARQLKAYARGAQAYLALHRANRTLRESTLGLWERLTYWVAEPQALRSLKP